MGGLHQVPGGQGRFGLGAATGLMHSPGSCRGAQSPCSLLQDGPAERAARAPTAPACFPAHHSRQLGTGSCEATAMLRTTARVTLLSPLSG